MLRQHGRAARIALGLGRRSALHGIYYRFCTVNLALPGCRYKQLLFFANKLEALPAEDHVPANKVEGCVSQVGRPMGQPVLLPGTGRTGHVRLPVSSMLA